MKIFINAKTEDVCEDLREILSEFAQDFVLCHDDKTQYDLGGCDAIVVSVPLRSEFGLNFVSDASKLTAAPIIVLARADIADDVQRRIRFTGAFVVEKPFKKSVLQNALKMAVLAKENINRLEDEKKELSKQLDDVKTIDRAKCCLIQYLNLTEEQAHRHIQKLAMDTRRSQREIAEDVLRTYLINN
ncbi:MAG: ANTAR domain-containing protein [Oscillospiraceae bacterium]|nr:ANTAR domain-containing protein [Oscillospiraceae bacterium]